MCMYIYMYKTRTIRRCTREKRNKGKIDFHPFERVSVPIVRYVTLYTVSTDDFEKVKQKITKKKKKKKYNFSFLLYSLLDRCHCSRPLFQSFFFPPRMSFFLCPVLPSNLLYLSWRNFWPRAIRGSYNL